MSIDVTERQGGRMGGGGGGSRGQVYNGVHLVDVP